MACYLPQGKHTLRSLFWIAFFKVEKQLGHDPVECDNSSNAEDKFITFN